MRFKKFMKWLFVGLGSLVVLILLAVAVVYIMIGRDLDRTFDVAGVEIVVPDDAGSISEGERLVKLRGCFDGCHGKASTGQVMFEMPDGTRVIAPDLVRIAQEYSIEDLDRAIRHGVKPDGTSVIAVMPSAMFYHLNDEELGAIVAYLRSREPGEEQLPETRFGPVVRLMLLSFKQIDGTILSAESIDHNLPRMEATGNEATVRGRYLAHTVCTECHGEDLRGASDGSAPDLVISLAYSNDDFRKLMRTGEPTGDRQLDLMAEVAVERFAYFNDEEMDDLHAYLQTLHTTPGDP